jgi:hypothetical protein
LRATRGATSLQQAATRSLDAARLNDFASVPSKRDRHAGCKGLLTTEDREMNDVKINGIIRNQKKLMAYNVIISVLLGGGLVASLVAMM